MPGSSRISGQLLLLLLLLMQRRASRSLIFTIDIIDPNRQTTNTPKELSTTSHNQRHPAIALSYPTSSSHAPHLSWSCSGVSIIGERRRSCCDLLLPLLWPSWFGGSSRASVVILRWPRQGLTTAALAVTSSPPPSIHPSVRLLRIRQPL